MRPAPQVTTTSIANLEHQKFNFVDPLIQRTIRDDGTIDLALIEAKQLFLCKYDDFNTPPSARAELAHKYTQDFFGGVYDPDRIHGPGTTPPRYISQSTSEEFGCWMTSWSITEVSRDLATVTDFGRSAGIAY